MPLALTYIRVAGVHRNELSCHQSGDEQEELRARQGGQLMRPRWITVHGS